MIEMTYQELVNPNFQTAFKRLMLETQFDVQTALKLARLFQTLAKESQLYADTIQKLMHKHKASNEAGSVKFPNSAEERAYLQDLNGLLQSTFKVEYDKLSHVSLGEIKLTPAQILALKPILCE